MRRLAMLRRPRLSFPRISFQRVALWAVVMWLVSSLGVAIAQADDNRTTPVGFAGMIPVPDLTGGGAKSIYEATSFGDYLLWSSPAGPIEQIVSVWTGMAWFLTVLLANGGIALAYWLLSLVGLDALSGPLEQVIGTTSAELITWLLPCAVVIGLVKSWAQHRGHQALSALLWVLVAGVLGLSLALSPGVWVGAVNQSRTIGADLVVNAANTATAGPDQRQPIEWPATDYGASAAANTGNGSAGQQQQGEAVKSRNVMLRKTGDATWRALVVTPWCYVQFGSLEACQRYGADWLKMGPNRDERQKYFRDTIQRNEGGDHGATSEYVKGNSPVLQLGTAVGALLIVVVAIGGIIVLGFAAITSLISAMLHLLLGVFFLMLACIEGGPRAIAFRWFQSLVGAVLQGIIALLLFTTMLMLLTVAYGLVPTLGWVPSVALAIAAMICAVGFRKQVAGFFGVMSPGGGAGLLGYAAARAATGAAGRLLRFRSSTPLTPAKPRKPRAEPDTTTPAGNAPVARRTYSPRPAARAIGSGPAAPALHSGSPSPSLPPGGSPPALSAGRTRTARRNGTAAVPARRVVRALPSAPQRQARSVRALPAGPRGQDTRRASASPATTSSAGPSTSAAPRATTHGRTTPTRPTTTAAPAAARTGGPARAVSTDPTPTVTGRVLDPPRTNGGRGAYASQRVRQQRVVNAQPTRRSGNQPAARPATRRHPTHAERVARGTARPRTAPPSRKATTDA